MSWNYRIMQHEKDGETWLEIHEVYYGKKGEPTAFTVKGVAPFAGTVDSMRDTLERMLAALDEPALTPDDFSAAFNDKETVE